MIPRTLVPVDVRPVKNGEAKAPPRRLETYMDERTVVPAGLPDANLPPLDGRTSIPAYLPLGALVSRTLVPRGLPAKPIERFQPITESVPIALLDARVVVPAYVEPAAPEALKEFEHAPEMTADLREVVEPDILITGEPNLLIQPDRKKDPKWDALTRVLSVVVHAGFIAFMLFWPKIFPSHAPSAQDIALAQKELSFVYLPPEVPEPPKPTPKLNINREVLNRVAPPTVKPPVLPPVNPERPPSDLPEAPKPQIPVSPAPAPAQPAAPTPSRLEPVMPATQQPNNRLKLGLSQASPGKLMQDQVDNAIRTRPSGTYIPPGGGGLGSSQRLQAGLTILTPTEGVDFSSYLTRLKAIVERNWAPLMPESARMGEKGIVATRIRIYHDGSMTAPYPILDRTSGRQPLDNAAMGALHASNPFPPLPSEFKGPYLEIEGVFFYNIDPNTMR